MARAPEPTRRPDLRSASFALAAIVAIPVLVIVFIVSLLGGRGR